MGDILLPFSVAVGSSTTSSSGSGGSGRSSMESGELTGSGERSKASSDMDLCSEPEVKEIGEIKRLYNIIHAYLLRHCATDRQYVSDFCMALCVVFE